MRITYDSSVDALYIELRRYPDGQVENRDWGPGLVADYGPDGLIAGIEVLDASTVLGDGFEKVVVELAPQRHSAA